MEFSSKQIRTVRAHNSRERRSPQSGYALATLMLFAAFLLIAMSAALPNFKTEAKREKELELEFRAMEYVRAIQAYNRKFPNQWPTSIDALMNTNNVRFLRKKFADPMTKDGNWRFIHLGPTGTVIDSQVTYKPTNLPSPTGTSTPAGTQQASPGPSSGVSGFSLSSATNPSAPSSLSPTEISNLPIVGIASRSTAEALMNCNGYNHYNEWEFIALPQGRYGGTGCYQGVPITMLLPPGAVAGQPAPTFGSTPTGTTTPVTSPTQPPSAQQPFGGLQPPNPNPPPVQ